MARLKKAAAKKPAVKKAVAPKVKTKEIAGAKKAVTKSVADNKAAVKKGSKLACQACGFAVTVDRTCGCAEEAHMICCDTPMKLKRPAAKKK